MRAASRPADRVLIADQVVRLARHFALQSMTPAEASTIVEDFIYDLRAYPGWAVVEACEKWRNNPQNKYRPTPGQLKEEVHERVIEYRRLLTGLENIIASTETV